MRAARRVVGAGALLALPGLLALQSREGAPITSGASTAASWLLRDGCAVCHPGAKKALAYSVHAGLLVSDSAAGCMACHTDAAAHAEAALDPNQPLQRPAAVTAQACAACHEGRSLAPSVGAHPWESQLDRLPEPPALAPIDSAPPELIVLTDSVVAGFDLGAVTRFGYRFVNVFGSRPRYETDVDLDGGFRLTDLELTARGRDGAVLDRASLTLTDLDDPYMRLRGELARDDFGSAKGRFERDAFKYRARGDFHRVDVRTQEWGFDLFAPVATDTEATFSFTRRLQDGFWLTHRIGNRNVTPQTPVANVSSPRDHDLNLYEVGLRTRAAGVDVRASVEYRAHDDVDTWFYSRPAPQNPFAIESENFTSTSTLHGPGARLQASDRSESLEWSLSGRVVDLERRIRGNGQATGFDISDYTTTTTAFADGDARTWLVDGTATWDVSPQVALLADLRFRDHREELHVDQVDVTDYPNLNNRTVTTLDLDQKTTQTVFEGTLSVQYEPVESLRLAAGYGFVRERLRVPDLDRSDRDFARGTIRNDGVLLDADWRPNERWVVTSRLRDFGQNGIQLHELSDDEVRTFKGKVRHQRDNKWVEVFTENRTKRNDVSDTRLDAWTSGVAAGLKTSAQTDVWTSYAFTDLESQTLTNFYFDPDPDPVPTFVGFNGTTHTVSAGLSMELSRRVHLDLSGAFTSTQGSFAVQVFDWRADLAAKICSSADLGVLVRQIDYHEGASSGGGFDDYGSYLTFLYVRTRFGIGK